MKILSIIIFLAISHLAYTQTNPLPPFNTTGTNAVTNSSVNNNSGTPMVKNPVENNNPSVQATIPLNSKPVSLETDVPQNNIQQPARIINDNAQANTPVKNTVVAATQGKAGTVIASNIPNDSLYSSSVTFPSSLSTSKAAQSTVLYNAATGVDAVKQTAKKEIKKSNGNTAPVLQTYVSTDIVNKFKSIYGESLYDIRLIRTTDNKTIYIIRTQENGIYKAIFLNEEGVVVQ